MPAIANDDNAQMMLKAIAVGRPHEVHANAKIIDIREHVIPKAPSAKHHNIISLGTSNISLK